MSEEESKPTMESCLDAFQASKARAFKSQAAERRVRREDGESAVKGIQRDQLESDGWEQTFIGAGGYMSAYVHADFPGLAVLWQSGIQSVCRLGEIRLNG